MRKIFLAFALVGALTAGGCSTLQSIGTAFSLVTKSVANPVTMTDLYQVESGVSLVFVALNTYRTACVQGTADKSCRVNIQAVQQYTRQLPPLLTQLRSFVKQNDQINATVVYNQLVTLITNFKTAAANVGINTGG